MVLKGIQDDLKAKKDQEKEEKPGKSKLRENIEAILVAIVLALFIRTFVVQAFKIPSGSMKETLQIGDHILVNKFIYGVKLPFVEKTLVSYKNPKHGDIIVFKYPEDPKKDFIKRVVGIEGDVVQVRNKNVLVNNKLLSQDFAIHVDAHIVMGQRDNFGPVTVPPNSLLVLGDNRDRSLDSRFWGFVDLKAVKGKAFIIYFSLDKENFKWVNPFLGVRWKRIGRLLK